VYKYSLIALICLGVIGLGIAFDAYTGFPASDGDTLTASMVNALANNLESLTDVIQDSGPDLTAVADVCNSAGDCLSTVSGGASLPSGMVIAHAGSACPSGWLLANGGSLATATYPDLFAIVVVLQLIQIEQPGLIGEMEQQGMQLEQGRILCWEVICIVWTHRIE